MLGAPRDLRLDADVRQLAAQIIARLVDVVLALVALLRHQALDLLVLSRVQRREREIL